MAAAQNHPYHLVNPSVWPLVGSIGALGMAGGAVMWMHEYAYGGYLFFAGLIAVLFVMFSWWADVIREAHGGDHTPVVQLHLRYGMILFIASEVMFSSPGSGPFSTRRFSPPRSMRSARPGRPRAWRCSIRSAFPCSTH